MPSNKPFFPNLRPVKKVVTPPGEILVRKECKRCVAEMGYDRGSSLIQD
jgi:hypothetical protein